MAAGGKAEKHCTQVPLNRAVLELRTLAHDTAPSDGVIPPTGMYPPSAEDVSKSKAGYITGQASEFEMDYDEVFLDIQTCRWLANIPVLSSVWEGPALRYRGW